MLKLNREVLLVVWVRGYQSPVRDYQQAVTDVSEGHNLFDLQLHESGRKEVVAVGKITAKHLQEKGIKVDKVAESETQEGIIHLLALEDMDQSYVFLPQSSKARCALSQTLGLVCCQVESFPAK